MTWTEASGTYWMAVLIMGVLGYISRRELHGARRPAPPRVHPQPHAALRLFGGV